MISKKVLTIAIGAALFGTASCRKQLDINLNPNVAQTSTPALLLPSAELAIGSALGVDFNNNGSIWVQHWTQNASASQYRTLEQYQPTGATYDRVWGLYYTSALPDLKRMDELAAASNQTQYQAIARILTAYSYQLVTDAWGDVPYTEALRGEPQNGGILNPRYQAQEVIYDSIIAMARSGRDLADPAAAQHPGSDDLIYGGDMDLWQRFANSLLLRMYLRLAYVNPAKAQAGVAELYSKGIGFLNTGEDAQITYSSTGGNQNPLAVEVRRLGPNQVASATSADSMNANNDPRRYVFYNPTTANVVGLRQGAGVAQTGVTYTFPNPITGASNALVDGADGRTASSAPVKLLTAYECYFLQAEAAARGWAAGSAQSLFEDGIYSNFETYLPADDPTDTIDESPDALAAEYIADSYWGQFPAGGNLQQQLRHIITQKWFSMNGNQGFEAWTEWRRTGFPDFLITSETSLIGAGRFPARFFYPDDEFSRNANFPGQKLIFERVWWDIN